MLHNSASTKVHHRSHSSHMKRSRDKPRTQKESYHWHNHQSVSEKRPDSSPVKIKLKIKVTEGIVEVVNTVTNEQRSSLKSTVSPKPAKPRKPLEKDYSKKAEKEYLKKPERQYACTNVRIPQDVASANEAVHCGIADSVKTKKRRCKDKSNSSYSPERSYSPELPMLMLSPKKRKSRKKAEGNVSTKWKSESLLNQSSYVLDKRKSFDTLRELFAQPEDIMCFETPTTSNQLYKTVKPTSSAIPNIVIKKEPVASTQYSGQDGRFKVPHNPKQLQYKILRNTPYTIPKRVIKEEIVETTPLLSELRKSLGSSMIPDNSKQLYKFLQPPSPSMPNLFIKEEIVETTPYDQPVTSPIIPNLFIKEEIVETTPSTPYNQPVTSPIIPNLFIKEEIVETTPNSPYNQPPPSIPNLFIKEEVIETTPSLDPSKDSFRSIEPTVTPSPVVKKEIPDVPLPYDIISDIERWFSPQCNTKEYSVDKVDSTVTDPTFENAKKKFFDESAATFVREYLDEGIPDVNDIDKTFFDAIDSSEDNQQAILENAFQFCESSPEIIIGSYEEAEEIVLENKVPTCMESPPYGSQESGYSSMSSPFSDDPEYQRASDSKKNPKEQPEGPLLLSYVQFLKMGHSYAKHAATVKWFAWQIDNSNLSKVISIKKFSNGHSSKMAFTIPKVNNSLKSSKESQLTKIKIVSNKCVSSEEPRKEISPRGNEHAKALHDRRVVYLGNIPSNYTAHSLREKFKRFGEIEYIQIKSKECDEIDTLDHRYLNSHPWRGRSFNQKEKLMKHFGFVTFKKIAAAREVFERRRELCTWPGGSINYGGRREFVKEEYADFDANPGCSFKRNQENEVDYTQLLKKEQEKRGLIATPTFKRKHSQQV